LTAARCGGTIGPMSPDAVRIRAFRERVRRHYRRHRRAMPWRETRDPYRILVSEVMLQQTQVDRVRPRYAAFLEAFPDLQALAAAPLPAVLAAWQGLGYNRRALALARTARLLVAEHGGNVPREPAALATLPGIGPATAASIAAFAFDAPVVFIETNIRRVFLHEFFPGREAVPDAELLPLVARALDRRRPREWYHALMDYGAALGRAVPNPNRRSAAYGRQAPFAGSDRQLRGAILRALLASGPLGTAALARAVGGGRERVTRLVGALAAEGFVVLRGSRAALAEGEEAG